MAPVSAQGRKKIFDVDVSVEGSWHISEAYPEWFGAKGDCVVEEWIEYPYRKARKRVSGTDDTEAFNKVLELGWPVVATNEYLITDKIQVFRSLDGKNSGTITVRTSGLENSTDICVEVGEVTQRNKSLTDNTILKNIKIYAEGSKTYGEGYNKGYGIYVHNYAVVECCDVRDFYYGMALVSYNIDVLNCQTSHNYVNIGIASAELRSGYWIEQANAINITGGEHANALSGINIKVGKTPWYKDNGDNVYSYGTRTIISKCSLDVGAVSIEDYGNIVVSDCYFEMGSSSVRSVPYNLYVGDNVSLLVVKNNYLSFNDYGIYCDSSNPPAMIITGNRYTMIDVNCIYLLNTPSNFVYEGNLGYSNYYRTAHFGIQDANRAGVVAKAKYLIDKKIIPDVYYYQQYVPDVINPGFVGEDFITYDNSFAIEGTFVEENKFHVTSNNAILNSIIPGSSILEGNKTRVTHVDYKNKMVHLQAVEYPDNSLTEIHTRKYAVVSGVLRRNSGEENIFTNVYNGAFVFDTAKNMHFFSTPNNVRNVETTVNGIVIVAYNANDLDFITSSTRLVEVIGTIDLVDKVVDLSNTFLAIRFNGGKIISSGTGKIIFDNTSLEGVVGNLANYIDCTIEGTYRLGQLAYDDNLHQEVYYNGSYWCRMDGSNVNANTSGTWLQRPTVYTDIYEGFCYMLDDGNNSHFPIYAHISGSTISWWKADGTEYTVS